MELLNHTGHVSFAALSHMVNTTSGSKASKSCHDWLCRSLVETPFSVKYSMVKGCTSPWGELPALAAISSVPPMCFVMARLKYCDSGYEYR